MRRSMMILGTLCVSAILLAPSPASGKGGAASRGILEEGGRVWMEACNRGDLSTMGELYSEDAWLLPPGGDTVEGRAGIEKHLSTVCDGNAVIGIGTTEIGVRRDLAYRVGTYRVDVGGRTVDRGKFVEVWRRSGGTWRIQRDIWNSSVPRAH